jgi:hypothetical protein
MIEKISVAIKSLRNYNLTTLNYREHYFKFQIFYMIILHNNFKFIFIASIFHFKVICFSKSDIFTSNNLNNKLIKININKQINNYCLK